MTVILIIILIFILLHTGAKTILKGICEGAKKTIDYCKEHKGDTK